MPPTFEFIPHATDLQLKVSDETLPQLFKLSLKGINEILKPLSSLTSKIVVSDLE
jgi:hypothetical protein